MTILKKITIILTIAIMCIICTQIISIGATATIITETLRLRKEPSTDSKIVDLISEDEKVEIIEANVGDDKNWYKVEYKGNTGYVYGRYIEVDNNTINSNSNTTKPNTNTTTSNNNTTTQNTNTNTTAQNNTTNTTISENNENTNNTVENNTQTENSNEENNNVGIRGTEPRKK